MKKIIMFSLLVLMSGFMFGTSFKGTEGEGVGETLNNSTKKENLIDEFLISGFLQYYDYSIKSLEEQTKELAESGLNWIDNPSWKNTGRNPWTREDWENFNDLANQLNIYYSIDSNIGNAQDATSLAEGLNKAIGYHIKDEPSAAQFQRYADLYLEYQNLDPTRFGYVNLYPNYAGASNLGGTYSDYVNNWVNTVGASNLEYLYFDHYPFTESENIRSSYFSDVETIRQVAYDNNKIKTGAYTQMGFWNGMRRPNTDMARWSMNSLISYGIKSISHFCWVGPVYVSPPIGEGMRGHVIESDGTKTELYEVMQRLNWQTRQLGPILMNIDVAHAYHSGDIPIGTEALPANFLLTPNQKDDNLIFSLAYNEDNEIYIMLFNKELEGSKTYNINVDKTSGIENITWFKPDSYDTLPNYLEALSEPEEVNVDFNNGSFQVDLQAGEMRLYKLSGDIKLKEQLKSPNPSLKSGTYVGAQTLTFSIPDEQTEIYYTIDGSYPNKQSIKYDKPINFGINGQISSHIIRAVSYRGDEVSNIFNGEYFIVNASENVALRKPVYLTVPGESFNGSGSTISVINDGLSDPYGAFATLSGTTGFAVIDFKDKYLVDKVITNAWHDWEFSDVVIQLANDEQFTEGVYTVFNNDVDNSLGLGFGTDGPYKEKGGSIGHVFEFEPVEARYIRFTNKSIKPASEARSIFEEIQVFTYYSEGENISTNYNDWQITGGGNWNITNDIISQTGGYNTSDWNRSFTLTTETYKNFILEAEFKFNVTDSNAWGYAGFGIYKPQITDVQGNVNAGYYVAVEPKGRVLLWNGEKPELGPEDANIPGFSLGSSFILKIVSFNNIISVSVNNIPVMHVKGDIFDRNAGYISIHSGLIPVSVSKLKILKLADDFAIQNYEETIVDSKSISIPVERYLDKEEVIKQLPSIVEVIDSAGVSHQVSVTWDSDEYRRLSTGFVNFYGKIIDLPDEIGNYLDYQPVARVFVKPEVDKLDLLSLIELGRSLNSKNFTVSSWNTMMIKLEAAEAINSDPYLVQNDIGVGVFQLYAAIYDLENILDKSQLETKIQTLKEFKKEDYLSASYEKLEEAIEEAEKLLESPLYSEEDLENMINKLSTTQQELRLNQKQSSTDIGNKPIISNKNDTNAGLITMVVLGLIMITIAVSLMIVIIKKR